MQSVDAVLRQAAADLDAIGARWAVIGGLAVAFRAEPRFTKDVEEVGVAVVPGILLDHVHQHLAERGRSLVSAAGHAEIGCLGHQPLRERDLS